MEKMMAKNKIVITWNETDGVFIAKTPDLPGCMAHGDTEESALRNIEEAIGLWIDTARNCGDFIPEPGNDDITTAEFDSLIAKTRQQAAEAGMRESDIQDAIKRVRKP